MTHRAWFWSAHKAFGLATLLLATPADAATLLEKTVSIAIQPDRTVLQRTRLEVRLETDDDAEAWTSYPVHLDENRSLVELDAHATGPDGRRVKARRKDSDTVQAAGHGSFYDSRRYHLVTFRHLAAGHTLAIEHAVEVAPYYPAGGIVLTGEEPIDRLRITVTGGDAGWTWRLDGPSDGLLVEETPGGVMITGRDLPAVDPPELAPGGAAVAVLRYAWGADATWLGVGRWYSKLLNSLPRAGEAVRGQARELTAGLDSRRRRLEAVLAFIRRQVRYTAVEIGIGGFRPSAPGVVLARRWGDCKDKSLLLIDLLAAAGIEAHPALIWNGADRRIDRELPSPWQFNHAIVAVPATAVEPGDDDPANAGYLFIDPTQTHGSSRWLHPGVQDQDALVVHAGGGTLVRTPIRQHLERHRLAVDLSVTPDGDAAGRAVLKLTGSPAAAWLELLAGAPPARAAEAAVAVFADLLPGATLETVGWSAGGDGVPAIELTADLSHRRLVRGRDARRSFRLTGATATPEPRRMAGAGLRDAGGGSNERSIPIVLRPHVVEARWRLTLPPGWCVPPADDQRISNDLGSYHQQIAGRGDRIVEIVRRAELRRRWIEPGDFSALEELARAEHQAQRRRIRLECQTLSRSAARLPAPVSDAGGVDSLSPDLPP